ncbi:hypothetical protein BZA70DRAFT_266129 [Myxozyma melibiosi]|uniref:DUF4048 domain-containing protein n=1 Tax=Myxozyma melibiosi TaxID=54550 RepID=A0ABR1FA39_9ASCO
MDGVSSPGLARASSLRATTGKNIYNFELVKKVRSDLSAPSSAAAAVTPGSNSGPSDALKERRRQRAFRLSLSIPRAPPPPPPEVTTPITEDASSVAPDLFVSPKMPTKPARDSVFFDEAADNFLTLLAAKERRVLELRSELASAEADLQQLQQQYSAHEERPRRAAPVPLLQQPFANALHGHHSSQPYSAMAAATTAASHVNAHVRARSSLDRQSITSASSSTSSTTTTITNDGNQTKAAGAGRMLNGSFPFPSPPKTAPSGRPLAPPRTSSLADKPAGDRAQPNPLSSSPAPIDDLPYLMHNDEFEYDDESRNNPNVPIRAEEVIVMGKKIAEGINSHFWNFYNDIKAAAVGEELLGAPSRRSGANGSPVRDYQQAGMGSSAAANGKSKMLERGSSAAPANQINWQHSRSSTYDSHDSANDYIDEDEGQSDDDDNHSTPTRVSDSPPIRHISSFVNSPVLSEPLGIDSAEFRGSPQSKHGHSMRSHPLRRTLTEQQQQQLQQQQQQQPQQQQLSAGEYNGYSVLRETPAAVSSTSLIDLESSEDESHTSAPPSLTNTVQSRISTTEPSKRYSVYNMDFDLAAATAAAGNGTAASSRSSSRSRGSSLFQ